MALSSISPAAAAPAPAPAASALARWNRNVEKALRSKPSTLAVLVTFLLRQDKLCHDSTSLLKHKLWWYHCWSRLRNAVRNGIVEVDQRYTTSQMTFTSNFEQTLGTKNGSWIKIMPKTTVSVCAFEIWTFFWENSKKVYQEISNKFTWPFPDNLGGIIWVG